MRHRLHIGFRPTAGLILAFVLSGFFLILVTSSASAQGRSRPSPTPTPTPTEPLGRIWHMLSATASAQPGEAKVYMYGGNGGIAVNTAVYDDFWYLDTTDDSWHFVQTSGKTRPGRLQSAAFACNGSGCFLAGGWSGQTLNDTWSYRRSDSTWTKLNCRKQDCPSARLFPSAAWDPLNGYYLYFGGEADHQDLNDTWTFDGTKWTQRFPSQAPPARRWTALAFVSPTGVPNSGGIAMFGGVSVYSGRNSAFCDVHFWDGTEWHEVDVTGKPGPCLANHSMFVDPLGGGPNEFTVMGGYAEPFWNVVNNEVWTFTFDAPLSGHWTLKSGGFNCTNSYSYPEFKAAADYFSGKKIIFGGFLSPSNPVAVQGLDICF